MTSCPWYRLASPSLVKNSASSKPCMKNGKKKNCSLLTLKCKSHTEIYRAESGYTVHKVEGEDVNYMESIIHSIMSLLNIQQKDIYGTQAMKAAYPLRLFLCQETPDPVNGFRN